MTPRDVEKLKAIGYCVKKTERGNWSLSFNDVPRILAEFSEEAAWAAGKAHAQLPDDATTESKIRWLAEHVGPLTIENTRDGAWLVWCEDKMLNGKGDSRKTAVDALFWKVS